MIPIQFEYLQDLYFDGCVKEKRHITIIGRLKQRYTGETIYRVRVQIESGLVWDDYVNETEIHKWLRTRVMEVK